MMVTRGIGIDADNICSLVVFGYSRKSVVEIIEEIIEAGWQLIKEFVLKINRMYEVDLEC